MRITGGDLRGRRLKTPPGDHVRPTQDMVREALFSMLVEAVPGSVFLDLFAGAGGVGVEAWSRGARSVTWVERDRKVARVLRENVEALCSGNPGRVVECDVFDWLASRRAGADVAGGGVDIVFADPPYATEGGPDGIEAVIAGVSASGLLAPGALFVAEQRAGAPLPEAPGWGLVTERRYGRSRLLILRKKEGRNDSE